MYLLNNTIEIMAIGEFAKILNYPFKKELKIFFDFISHEDRWPVMAANSLHSIEN